MIFARINRLLLLVPLAMLWGCLCVFVPWEWRECGYVSVLDEHRFSSQTASNSTVSYTVFDIEKHIYYPVDQWVKATRPPVSGLSLVSRIQNAKASQKTENLLEMKIYDHRQEQFVRTLERSFPFETYPRLIAGRFLVAYSTSEMFWLDLNDESEQWQSMTIATAAPGGGNFYVSKDESAFIREFVQPLPPASAAPPTYVVELYRFNAQNLPVLQTTWQASNAGFGNANIIDDAVVNLDLAGTHVESRSLLDGQLQKTLLLAQPIDPTKEQFAFQANSLMVWQLGRPQRYVSLEDGREIKSPYPTPTGNTRLSREESPDNKTAVMWIWGSQHASIVDARTDEVLATIESGGSPYRYLDSQTLLSLNDSFGLTIRTHDVKTGKTLSTWRPFWWVWPLLALAMPLTAVWVVAWLRLPRGDGMLAWIDLGILLLLLMLLIVGRLISVGDSMAVYRPPYQYAICLTVSYMIVAWSWAVLSGTAIVQRISVLISLYAIVLGALAWTMTQDITLAWTGIALVSTPALLLLPLSVIARFCGYKLEKSGNSNASIQWLAARMTTGQLMLVTVVFALLFLAARPLWPGMRGLLNPGWEIWRLVGATASGGVGLLLGLSLRHRLLSIALFISAGFLCLLVVEKFSSSYLWRVPSFVPYYSYVEVIMMCTSVLAVTLIVSSVVKLSARS